MGFFNYNFAGFAVLAAAAFAASGLEKNHRNGESRSSDTTSGYSTQRDSSTMPLLPSCRTKSDRANLNLSGKGAVVNQQHGTQAVHAGASPLSTRSSYRSSRRGAPLQAVEGIARSNTARNLEVATDAARAGRLVSAAGTVTEKLQETAVARADAVGSKLGTNHPARSEPSGGIAGLPSASVAASLSANLSDREWSELNDHQQLAITELGAVTEEVPASIIPTRHRSTIPESDEYLRATLGHDGFNQLSFLAASKRQQLAEEAETLR